MKKKVIIIGAGIAGIAASIRLNAKGYAVEVFEANPYPGGKLSAFSIDQYRFDAGPSLFTMPNYVDELFALCGENPRTHFNYQKKDLACKYFWEDGKRLNAYSDQEKYLEEVEQQLGVSPKVLKAYLAKAKKKYDLTVDLFLEKSLHRWSTLFSFKTLEALSQLPVFEINKSLDAVNRASLKEPHLVQMYNRFATYNGSSPYQTPGIMTLIQHLESHYGTYIPEGGMVSISKSLYELAQRQGVKFEFNQKDELIISYQIKVFDEFTDILDQVKPRKKANQLLHYIYLFCDRSGKNALRDLDTAVKEEQCRWRAFKKKDVVFSEKEQQLVDAAISVYKTHNENSKDRIKF